MLNTKLSELVVNEQALVIARLCAGGYIDVMTGDQPENATDEIERRFVLVTLRFADPAFKDAVDGTIIANPLISNVAIADGVPKFFIAYAADHQTVVFSGSAGTEKANMILPVKMVVAGMTIGGAGLTHSVIKSMPGV